MGLGYLRRVIFLFRFNCGFLGRDRFRVVELNGATSARVDSNLRQKFGESVLDVEVTFEKES